MEQSSRQKVVIRILKSSFITVQHSEESFTGLMSASNECPFQVQQWNTGVVGRSNSETGNHSNNSSRNGQNGKFVDETAKMINMPDFDERTTSNKMSSSSSGKDLEASCGRSCKSMCR